MIIVSLTTTSQRLELCRQSVISLLYQSLKPDKIVVWVSKEPYLRDHGIVQAPYWVKELNALKETDATYPFVEVEWTKNIGPYRKLIPTLRNCNEDDLIVTADDDIVYGKNWLKKLVNEHYLNPDHLIACRVKEVKKNVFDKEKSYLKWPLVKKNRIIHKGYCITHGGGAVFKKSFIDKNFLDIKSYMQLAPTADDLWYSKLLELNNVSVKVVPSILDELFFIKHNDGLLKHNLPLAMNVYRKAKLILIDKPLGGLGFSVCGNDVAYKKIKKHFIDSSGFLLSFIGMPYYVI